MNLYDTLGVYEKATQTEIKKAYRTKSMKLHPDRGGDDAEFALLEEAYRILSNKESREQYDRTGTVAKEPPSIEHQARAELCRMFLELVRESMLKNRLMAHVDILGGIKSRVLSEIQKQKENLRIGDTKLSKLEEVLNRVHCIDPDIDNILAQALSSEIESFKASRKGVEHSIKLNGEILKVLDSYKYDYTKLQQSATAAATERMISRWSPLI